MAKEQEFEAAVDTFAALEQRVVRTIEMLNREREQRAEIEKQLASARAQLDAQQAQGATLQREIEELHRERDTVRCSKAANVSTAASNSCSLAMMVVINK